ncbi:Dihydropteroate synthase [Geoalkalibacter ferrihydriticus]|uniref:Dihydropteroate synthase n=2 Tax=Geoalkalibacter ferrihydriticus TaxID=392333 RepID=A0A0C2DUI9_9BACT|nr:dihydropteroate synthase [Geoalkalibacter ferrihydriticus]KIH77099.1 dihydropteroate synthase [Geoalkalibacter ferrihydriticus DSM 17813]SDL34423.1 Dihydropteroate synthase [Geoalkalibacter ferrihydriticus]
MVGSLVGRSCRLDLRRPCIMGILNVTPDSFSDGGRFVNARAALDRARLMVDEGADLLDIGGESTRPGALAVTAEEELARVVPVIELLSCELSVPLSIDTTKSRVARAAIAAGAHFINDISGLHFDPEMAGVAAETGAGLFLMHTSHRPDQMQAHVRYQDLIGEICRYLERAISMAQAAGVSQECIAVDPGIGFGKSTAGNLEILRRLPEFHQLGRPLLLGTSRKSFLGALLDQPDPRKRLYPTLATVALGVAAGASIFRVHDVGPAREAALTAFAVHSYSPPD